MDKYDTTAPDEKRTSPEAPTAMPPRPPSAPKLETRYLDTIVDMRQFLGRSGGSLPHIMNTRTHRKTRSLPDDIKNFPITTTLRPIREPVTPPRDMESDGRRTPPLCGVPVAQNHENGPSSVYTNYSHGTNMFKSVCCSRSLRIDRRLLTFAVQTIVILMVLVYSMHQAVVVPREQRETYIIIITTILSVYLPSPQAPPLQNDTDKKKNGRARKHEHGS